MPTLSSPILPPYHPVISGVPHLISAVIAAKTWKNKWTRGKVEMGIFPWSLAPSYSTTLELWLTWQRTNQCLPGYCIGADWQRATMSKKKRKQIELDCTCSSRESWLLYLQAKCVHVLTSPSPSRSCTRGLRRRVARCPQRVLNTAVHFTACKAIISIPASLSLPPPAAGTAESAHLRMESGSLNRDVIDLPLFVRGKCSQTSQANFSCTARPGTPSQ